MTTPSALRTAAYFAARDALAGARRPAAAAAAAVAAFERAWAGVQPRVAGSLACRTGCASCCHQRVTVLPAEAAAIATHVRKRPDADPGDTLAARIAAAVDAPAGSPCPFLDADHACVIYPVRPIRCRGVHSRDVAACAKWTAPPGAIAAAPGAGAFPPEPIALADAALAGLGRALAEAGQPAESVDLAEAVDALLREDAVKYDREPPNPMESPPKVPIFRSMNDMMLQQAPADGESRSIKLHGPDEFEGMRRAGRLAAETLDYITSHVVPGVTTGELDRLCHDFITARGAIPAPLGYRGFPKSICTSINHVVCHGIPGDKRLAAGDIMNIDVTVILDGWHGDTSRMFCVGDVGVRARKLVDATYEAMMRGIEVVRPGATLGDIGHAIQSFAERNRFLVVRDFCGHGLGRVFHDAPSVLHYGDAGRGLELREGMFFTIEPMINAGTWQVKLLADGWTAVTKDRQLSAQFEHSIGVTATGYEIFTLSPKGWHNPPYG